VVVHPVVTGGRWAAPGGRWAAPGRVNLIGEHTDYNDGYVLPLALEQRITVTATPVFAAPAGTGSAQGHPPGRISGDRLTRLRSRQVPGEEVTFSAETVEPGDVTGWGAYVAGVVWALRSAGHQVGDLDVTVDGNVPLGAGLSSSAALECAAMLAWTDLFGIRLDRTTMARLCQRAENDFVGAPTGIMDQMAALYGREGHLVFLDTRSLEVSQIPLDLAAAGLSLLVVDTRAPHRHVDGEYAARRRSCEEAARLLGVPALRDADLDRLDSLPPDLLTRARHVVTENARVLEVVGLLRSGADPREIGPLLTASHVSLRDDFEVTVPEVDLAVNTLLGSGAYGARITGGGFGGCVIALVDAEREDAATAAVRDAYHTAGFAAPDAFRAVPSAGARRVR
jgi:galactokinase